MSNTIDEYLKKFYTSMDSGLSEEEAKKRLEHYGLNTIERGRVTAIDLAVRIVVSPVNLMIIFSSIVFFFVGKIHEGLFSLVLFLINFLITFVQEYKSERELEELKKRVQVDVEVKRDGKWKKVKSLFLVPGDIVRLKSGDTVPADILIIKGNNVLVDESPVTGESIPKEKSEGELVYSSSIVRRGWLVGLVVATGKETKYGKVLHLIQHEKQRSNLESLILRIGKFLIGVAIILAPLIFIHSYFISKIPLYLAVIYSLIIFISFIPAALPAVSSSILVVVARNLSKKDILVRRLSSIFDIGSMNMLCTDKTGTLTENVIKLDKIVCLSGNEAEILAYSYASSDPESGDPIDNSILEEFKKRGINIWFKVLEFYPYDSVRKYSYAIIEEGGNKVWVAKGSPEVLLKKIGREPDEILEKIYEDGYRVLAVVKDNELLGYLAFYDPPRKDAKHFLSELMKRGISIKILTGDSAKVAKKIAKEVGVESSLVVNRDKLKKVSDRHFDFLVKECNIFAEIFPEDKYRIVDALRREGYVVGVTGDGINDIGAIKRADVGIAVYNATNATKSFADLILTAPGLSQLVEAVDRSREAIRRLENYIIYRIAEDLRFPFLISLFLLIYKNPILTPIYVLLLKVLNDIPILAIAFDRVKVENKPHEIQLKITIPLSIILGIVGILNSFFFVFLLKLIKVPNDAIPVFLFLKLVLSGHFLLYVVRTREYFWFQDLPSLQLFIPTFLTQLIGTFVAVFDVLIRGYHGLVWIALFTWIYAFVWLNITDIIKVLCISRLKYFYSLK